MQSAGKEFEAFVLQSFIQEMLPKNAESVFGGGIAGEIWKSMLAEQLAARFAGRGDFGIAELVEKSDSVNGTQAPSASARPLETEQTPAMPAKDGWVPATTIERS
jgi:Rod binding domain-containing protein